MRTNRLTKTELEMIQRTILESMAASLSACILVFDDDEERNDFISRHCAMVSQAMSAAGSERDGSFEELVSTTIEKVNETRQGYFDSVAHQFALKFEGLMEG